MSEPWTKDELEDAVEEAYAAGQAVCRDGRVATYIPELARVSPDRFGVVAHTISGQRCSRGDVDERFTLQSASKVFSLSLVLGEQDPAVFSRLSVEPSGDPFFSIVKLEEEKGRPRNPYINAGAIVVTSRIDGASPAEKADRFRAFLQRVVGAEPDAFPVDEAVFRSEAETGHRNLALAEIMAHHRVVDDPALAAQAYFRQCAVAVTARELARLGLFLAAGGTDPVSGALILDPVANRRVVALMMTCGMYDEVGRHAVAVGLPTKSAVSGGMLAVVPRRMAIATWGPSLGPKGNSVAGMAALACISDRLGLSLFD